MNATAPVTVVIPAYNEAPTVGRVVQSVPRRMAGLDVTVLVVDDGSADGTAEAAEAAGASVIRHQTNRGQGAALLTGYRAAVGAGSRYLATVDADGQWDPADLPALIEVLAAGEADLVSGSRRLGSDQVREPLRQLGVVVFAALLRRLTGARVSDPANGLRAMRAEVVEGVRLEEPQFQAAELLTAALSRGFRYAEVPVRHFARSAGESKKGRNLTYGLRYGRVLARTWWRERRR
ncbi:MAG TPA: glycosyltransferase family 2 protein [Acidimicrobiales bacterium]|nr:glycosyltransferase family 2 protein [Acidimicrobiales bacterium]